MKRTGFKKPDYKGYMAKQILKPRKPLRKTKIRVKGISTTAELKDEIQALLRQLAIKRDKVCILSHYPEAKQCGGYTKNGDLILQAEHLNSRSHASTFGDMRNIVLLCKYHHIYWKPQNSSLYWELVKKHIGEEKYTWYIRARDDHRAYKVDLKLTKLALEQDLRNYE